MNQQQQSIRKYFLLLISLAFPAVSRASLPPNGSSKPPAQRRVLHSLMAEDQEIQLADRLEVFDNPYDLRNWMADEAAIEQGPALIDEDGNEFYILPEKSAKAGARGDHSTRIHRSYHGRSCAAVSGEASWYGPGFNGRKTANGERFNQNALTAAHKTLAFGSLVQVTYQGRSVNVRINDSGPYVRGRVIDLSREAAAQIGLLEDGAGRVLLKVLRCGPR